MKKTFMAVLMFALLAFIVSCGGTTKDDKKDGETKDTVVVDQKPVVKDFQYFDGIAKSLKLEGLELTSANKYSDTASKAFSYGYEIKDAKDKGADKIMITAGSVKRLGNKEDVVTNSLADFEKAQTKLNKNNKDITCSDFKEWKKAENTFYYYTIKGASETMSSHKNFNKLSARYVKDDVYLDIIISIYDNKVELTKAEQILIKAMEYMVK
jgi:hypothetical protein